MYVLRILWVVVARKAVIVHQVFVLVAFAQLASRQIKLVPVLRNAAQVTVVSAACVFVIKMDVLARVALRVKVVVVNQGFAPQLV